MAWRQRLWFDFGKLDIWVKQAKRLVKRVNFHHELANLGLMVF